MKIKRYLYWITALILFGLSSGLGLVVQSNADDPEPKATSEIFLPFVTGGEGGSDTTSVTANLIEIAQGPAGGGRLDAFTFFIPYAAEAMAIQFDAASLQPEVTPGLPIVSTISIAVNRDNTIIYYDQWEDALEGDPTVPTQITTLVWGDGDPSNNTTGLAAGATVQGIPASDILTAGTIITLRSTVPSTAAGRGTPPSIFFDGGDMLVSRGGALAVSTIFWTDAPGPEIFFTDAWELYPTNRWGQEYVTSIGENVLRDGPGNRGDFGVVGLNIQAVDNDTVVEIDLNADGTFDNGILDPVTTTLDQGEQLSIPNGILAGTRVRASGPVQAHLIASDPDSRFEMRGYTLVPFDQWTNDYLAPRASDGDFWLYNPNNTPLPITVESDAGTTVLTVPANSTARYLVTTPPFDDDNTDDVDMAPVTGLHFSSNGPIFYGMAALDSFDAQDWGYDILPTNNLTSQTLIGLGVGNRNILQGQGCPATPRRGNNGREMRVYVTSLTATTIFVDVNNDGTPDEVDVTGDGTVDPYPGPGIGYALSPLQEMSITDPFNAVLNPDGDCDMTGAFLYTPDGTPFAAVWGQDENANAGIPSIDAGTSIVPLRSLAIQKTFNLLADMDCSGSISLGDAVRFQLEYINDSALIINNVIVSDTLPAALGYIPDTTVEDGQPVPDNGGSSPYPLDGSGLDTGSLPDFGTSILTYDATVRDTSAAIINRANASSRSLPLQGDAVTIFVPTGSPIPIIEITKTRIAPASGPVDSGQTVTFNLTITNSGSTTITTLPLEETYNSSLLTFASAVPAPDTTANGVLTWNDLVAASGPLPPNASVNVTLSYTVNQLPAGTNDTTLTATVKNALRQNSPVPLTCSNEAELLFAGAPSPTDEPVPPSDNDNNKNNDNNSNDNNNKAPAPTPTPIPVAGLPATPAAPAFPVAFLPETGLRGTGLEGWVIAGGLILLAVGGFVLHSRYKK